MPLHVHHDGADGVALQREDAGLRIAELRLGLLPWAMRRGELAPSRLGEQRVEVHRREARPPRRSASRPRRRASRGGPSSSSARAMRTGLAWPRTAATAPARRRRPSMTAASCSMSPSAVRTAPRPALNSSSFSSATVASTTASTAVPSVAQRRACCLRPRGSGPALRSGARSGLTTPPPAPPCTTTMGPWTGIASDMRSQLGRSLGIVPGRGYQPKARSLRAPPAPPRRRSAAVSTRGGSAGTMPLERERAPEGLGRGGRENAAVAVERLLVRAATALDLRRAAHARTQRRCRSRTPGGPLLRRAGRVSGGVADEEDPAPVAGTQAVGEPVALVANGLVALPLGEPHRRLSCT